MTLDGIFEDPGGAEKTRYGGWNLPFMLEEEGKYKFDELMQADSLLLGRITYEGFAKAWPTMEGTGAFGEKMNSMPKYVVSTTLEKAEWQNSHIIKANIADEIQKIKDADGDKNILVAGSGQLVKFLLENNLADEVRLMVQPLVLGKGKRPFDGAYKKLQLFETKTFANGVIALHYQVKK